MGCFNKLNIPHLHFLVYVSSSKDGEGQKEITNDFTVTVSGQKITVSTADLKKIAGVEKGKYVIVE